MVGNGNANGIPFINKHTDEIKPIVWYDIKKQGCTNESLSNNPVLIDLSGNGHNLTLNNFAFSGMSGVGGYYFDTLTTWFRRPENDGEFTVDNTKLHITKTATNSANYYYLNNNRKVEFNDFINNYTDSSITFKSFKIKISGLPEGYDIKIDGLYNDDVEGSPHQRIENIFLHNGEHIINIGTVNLENVVSSGQCHFPRIFTTSNMPQVDCDITVEFLPEYPDALVSDGINDYGYVEGLPLLTDYTVIAKRKLLSNKDDGLNRVFISKRTAGNYIDGAFTIEKFLKNGNVECVSFGNRVYISVIDGDITYQSKNSYNGTYLANGNLEDTKILIIFANTFNNEYMSAALYSFVLFDRSLTDTQIKDWIRKNIDEDYLLPSERPKANIYYDFRNGDNSNLTTVTDLSGNERHGTMYNFTGEADSGYSDGCLKFNGIDNYIQIPYSNDAVYKTVILLVRPSISNGANMIYDGRYATGLTTGICLFYESPEKKYLSSRLSDNAKLYINGVINTSYTNADMNGKKNCVAVSDNVLSTGTVDNSPIIGTVRNTLGWTSNMELYAFLGFDKILTEEEIKYVMNKYNLLEDIDELII